MSRAIVEDRAVGGGRARKQPRRSRLRVVHGAVDQLGGAAHAEEMRHIELTVGRPAADLAGELKTVGLGQRPRHGGSDRGIVAQLHDCTARGGIADHIVTGSRLGDGIGVLAVTEIAARLLDGGKPGLIDELIESLRRRCGRARGRIEVGLHLCSGEQVFEAGAGGARRLLDRTGHPCAHEIESCRDRAV